MNSITKLFTESNIIQALVRQTQPSMKLWINNAYVFRGWESDFLLITRSGYCVEYEVKISRSDFFSDFKKTAKHSILKDGTFINYLSECCSESFRPNRFYFVVPENMVSIDEVPHYSGLIYCRFESESADVPVLEIVKRPPVLHTAKLELEKILCIKYFWKLGSARREISELKKQLAGK